jgi:hypothetical protein
LFCSFFANSGYFASLDYSKLRENNSVTIINKSDKPLRCSLRVFNDKMYAEIDADSESNTIKMIDGVKIHNISLQCKHIKNITKFKHWRTNNYSNKYTKHHVFI